MSRKQSFTRLQFCTKQLLHYTFIGNWEKKKKTLSCYATMQKCNLNQCLLWTVLVSASATLHGFLIVCVAIVMFFDPLIFLCKQPVERSAHCYDRLDGYSLYLLTLLYASVNVLTGVTQ